MTITVTLDRPRKDGTRRVLLAIGHGAGVRMRYPLPFHVQPKAWDKVRRRAKLGTRNFAVINEGIDRMVGRAEALAIGGLDAPGIVAALSQERPSFTMLTDALAAHLKEHSHRLSHGTVKIRGTVIRDLERVLPSATLAGLTAKDVMVYDRYLTTLHTNTRRSRLRLFRTMYRGACSAAGIVAAEVFTGLIPKEVPRVKHYLTTDELDRLGRHKFFHPVSLAVDAWLLQYYLGGLRFGELCRLTHEMYSNGAFRWSKGKVGRVRYHPVNAKAREIIAKYRVEGDPRVLPLIALPLPKDKDQWATRIEQRLVVVNRQLRRACERVGIPVVTTHNARHSAAHRIKTMTKDVHVARQILGHATIRQTEVYLNDLDHEGVDEVIGGM